MKWVVAYLLFWVSIQLVILWANAVGSMPAWIESYGTLSSSLFLGSVGGVLYCLRGVYLNYSVRKDWDKDWHIWYFLRPIVSSISGGISWVFLTAGLLVLDATEKVEGSSIGYLAVAFIAGYNVDKFMSKLEQLAEATWGIKKSRSGSSEPDSNKRG